MPQGTFSYQPQKSSFHTQKPREIFQLGASNHGSFATKRFYSIVNSRVKIIGFCFKSLNFKRKWKGSFSPSELKRSMLIKSNFRVYSKGGMQCQFTMTKVQRLKGQFTNRIKVTICFFTNSRDKT